MYDKNLRLIAMLFNVCCSVIRLCMTYILLSLNLNRHCMLKSRNGPRAGAAQQVQFEIELCVNRCDIRCVK